jgi:hypothetical protein
VRDPEADARVDGCGSCVRFLAPAETTRCVSFCSGPLEDELRANISLRLLHCKPQTHQGFQESGVRVIVGIWLPAPQHLLPGRLDGCCWCTSDLQRYHMCKLRGVPWGGVYFT